MLVKGMKENQFRCQTLLCQFFTTNRTSQQKHRPSPADSWPQKGTKSTENSGGACRAATSRAAFSGASALRTGSSQREEHCRQLKARKDQGHRQQWIDHNNAQMAQRTMCGSTFRTPNSALASDILPTLRQMTRLGPDGPNRFNRQTFHRNVHRGRLFQNMVSLRIFAGVFERAVVGMVCESCSI
jgi:hypothetical protein